jgi:hypothetical protein
MLNATRSSLLIPELTEQFESSRPVARIMVVRESQNHDSSLVNFLEDLDPLDKVALAVDDTRCGWFVLRTGIFILAKFLYLMIQGCPFNFRQNNSKIG